MGEVISTVIANLRRNARRSTLLAAPILVGNIVLQALFIGGVEGGDLIRDRFEQRGGDLVSVRRTDPADPLRDDTTWLFRSAEAVAAAELNEVEAVGAMVTVSEPMLGLSVLDEASSSVELRSSLTIVGDGALDAAGAQLLHGRMLAPDDFAGVADIALLGREVAAHYAIDDNAIDEGVALLVYDTPVRIVGVMASNSRQPSMDRAVVVPTEAPLIAEIRSRPDWDPLQAQELLLLRAGSINATRQVADVSSLVIESQQRTPPTRSDFDGALLQSYDDGLASLRWSLLVAGGLGAVAALASCAYLQISSIKLRRSEFGLRLAIGMPPRRLRSMLLVESLVIGGLGWAATALASVVMLQSVLARDVALVDLAGLLVGTLTLSCLVSAAVPARSIRRIADTSPADLLAG